MKQRCLGRIIEYFVVEGGQMKSFGLFLMGLGVVGVLISNAVGNAASGAYTTQSVGSALFVVISIILIILGFIMWIGGSNDDKDNNIRPLL
jgi:hypothetical protein